MQIENGAAVITDTRTIARNECEGRVNRYASFTPHTMEQLYTESAELVRREGTAVTIQTDAQGVIERCVWKGDPGCFDNCGEGFLIRTWSFGTNR